MSLSGEVRSWNWECFHRMKKNEIKTGRNKPPEVRTREQIEDRAFNRMLLWLATAAVVEVVMVLINRFYVHTRVSELGIKMPLYKVLTVFPIAGAVLFVLFLVWAVKVRNGDSGKDGTLQAAVACGFLCMGIGGLLMRNLETTAAPMVLAVVPGLGVLMMVFYLYQKEFFGCAVIGGMGLLGVSDISQRRGVLRLFGPHPGNRGSGGGIGPQAETEGWCMDDSGQGDCGSPAWRGLSAVLFDGGGDSHSPFGAAGAGGCCGLLRDVDYGCVAVYPGGLFHLKIDVKTKTGPIE